jgi:hypothetical protein
MLTGGCAATGAGDDELIGNEIIVTVVGVMGEFRLLSRGLPGLIGEVGGVKVGNLDISAIVARFIDVMPLMIGLDLLNCDVAAAPGFGALGTFVGEVGTTGVGFIMAGIGFIMAGVGFIMAGVGFIIAGMGFIMVSIPVIPIPMDSRSLCSRVSTEIDACRRALRASKLRRYSASYELMGLVLS